MNSQLSTSPSDNDVNLVVAITSLIARHFGTTITDLVGRRRPWRLVLPRWIVWTLLRDAGLNPTRIGRFFGRCHTTIYHGLIRLQSDLETSKTARAAYDAVLSEIHPEQEAA